ncbi:hypothetical protein ABTY63_14985 [Streptomyces solisilvae]|uniref:hypothetical protein n=1 Tax=Streptomyces malaysiensis TaxID=92644 RepID=UPI003330AC3D
MTTATPAPDIATRRATVRQARDEGLSHRAIGARLKISKDTVRRDLEALARADETAARVSVSQPAPPNEPPSAAGDDGEQLLLHQALPEIVTLARAAQSTTELDCETLAQAPHDQLPYLMTALAQTIDLLSATLPAAARHHPTAARITQHQLRQLAHRLTACAHTPTPQEG